jgi:predicted nucleotidyltransferase
MINSNFKKAIKIIHKLLSEKKIKWALIGSTNMQLQGMDIQPHDLDIVIQLKDLDKMQKIFSEYNVSAIKEKRSLTNNPFWEVKVEIDGVEVQIFGEKSNRGYVSKLLANRLINIQLNGIKIPCFTLEAEAQTYAEINRGHKAHLIQEFLNHKKL